MCELFPKILYKNLRNPESGSLLSRGFDFFLLTKVSSERYDFTLVLLLKPLEYDRGIEPAGVREYSFLDHFGGVGREACTEES